MKAYMGPGCAQHAAAPPLPSVAGVILAWVESGSCED